MITLGVSTTASTVSKAAADNAEQSAALIAALKQAGVAEADISTTNYSINPRYEYGDFGTSVLAGYAVSNMLSVTIRDLDRVGAVLDQATASGANECYGISYTSEKMQSASDQALTNAVGETRRRAGIAAQAEGMELDTLVSLREGGSYSYTNTIAFDAEMPSMKSAGTEIKPGRLAVTVTVTAEWSMK